MAAPHVSGALALLLSRLPHIPMPVLKAILLATATDLGAPGVDDVYGHGLVNIAAAITVQGEITLADDDVNDDNSALPNRAVDNAHKRMRLSRTMAHLSHQMSNLSVAFNFMDDYYFGASYQSFITPQQTAAPLLGNAAADLAGRPQSRSQHVRRPANCRHFLPPPTMRIFYITAQKPNNGAFAMTCAKTADIISGHLPTPTLLPNHSLPPNKPPPLSLGKAAAAGRLLPPSMPKAIPIGNLACNGAEYTRTPNGERKYLTSPNKVKCWAVILAMVILRCWKTDNRRK